MLILAIGALASAFAPNFWFLLACRAARGRTSAARYTPGSPMSGAVRGIRCAAAPSSRTGRVNVTGSRLQTRRGLPASPPTGTGTTPAIQATWPWAGDHDRGTPGHSARRRPSNAAGQGEHCRQDALLVNAAGLTRVFILSAQKSLTADRPGHTAVSYC